MNDIYWRARSALRRYLAKKRRFGVNVYANHAWSVTVSRNLNLHVWHRMRASRLSGEWHKWDGTNYLSVTVADPKVHRRWATHATLYLPWLPGKDRTKQGYWR